MSELLKIISVFRQKMRLLTHVDTVCERVVLVLDSVVVVAGYAYDMFSVEEGWVIYFTKENNRSCYFL